MTVPTAVSTCRSGVCGAFSRRIRPRRASFRRHAAAATCSCRTASKMRRPIDSLFGRLVVLVIAVLVLSHLAWFAVIRVERDQTQTRYAVEEAIFLVDAVRQHIATAPDQPLPSRVRIISPTSTDVRKPIPDTAADSDKMPPAFAGFIDDLRDL